MGISFLIMSRYMGKKLFSYNEGYSFVDLALVTRDITQVDLTQLNFFYMYI